MNSPWRSPWVLVVSVVVLSLLAYAATSGPAPAALPLDTVAEATDFAAVRGITLSQPAVGAHATRKGETLYDETVFVAGSGSKVSVLQFPDSDAAREMAPLLAENNPHSRSLLRGHVVFITSDPIVFDGLLKPPALPDDLAGVDRFFTAQGMTILDKRASLPNDAPEHVDYVLGNGARIQVYRFETSRESALFAKGVARSGTRVVTSGHILFLVPDAAANLFDRVALPSS